jgi:hypothetical protein
VSRLAADVPEPLWNELQAMGEGVTA